MLTIVYNVGLTLTINNNRPANTPRWSDVDLMLVHRLRRWPNIKSTSDKRALFAGILPQRLVFGA